MWPFSRCFVEYYSLYLFKTARSILVVIRTLFFFCNVFVVEGGNICFITGIGGTVASDNSCAELATVAYIILS